MLNKVFYKLKNIINIGKEKIKENKEKKINDKIIDERFRNFIHR